MYVRVVALLSVFFIATFAGSQETPPAKNEEARKDILNLQGTWQLDSFEGKAKVDVKKRTLFIGGELMILRDEKRILQIGTVRLVTSKSPRRIDVVVKKGMHADNTMLGIYEIKGDTLKLCMDPEGDGRPAKFVSKADTDLYLAVFKRVKAPGEGIDIRGKYISNSFDPEGKKTSMAAEIEKRGDGYLVRWTVPAGVAFIGTGIRQGNTLSVSYANRGTIGLVVYKIEKGPRLIGSFTDVGGPGLIAREELVPDDKDSVEVRNRR